MRISDWSSDVCSSDLVAHELQRQQDQIELIASENIVSQAVLEAQGSIFTNKYAEGYPGRRYYQGCGPSDEVEALAIDRARQLFDCPFANVQPHSGAQANGRSEEHTSELQSLMRISYAVFCLKKKKSKTEKTRK